MTTTGYEWMASDLDALDRHGLLRQRRPMSNFSGHLNFASNDYLNLAADPRAAEAAAEAARRFGCGAGSSALVSGWHDLLEELEDTLARFEGQESALVFPSGYAANLAVISALTGADETVFSDELNHASLIDGCRLSKATVHVFRHNDLNHLESLLKEATPAGRRYIVTESLFSMDGDFAPLSELADLANHHNAFLIVDEAHATGVYGENGSGLCSEAKIDCPLIKVGTLSKAIGAQGGFIAGPKILRDYLVNRARQYIFSTALAPPICAATIRNIRIVKSEPNRRRELVRDSKKLRSRLQLEGFDTGATNSYIIPLILGRPDVATQYSRLLESAGLLVPAIRPPSVPAGSSRLRISLTAAHSEKDIDRLIHGLRSCRAAIHQRAVA